MWNNSLLLVLGHHFACFGGLGRVQSGQSSKTCPAKSLHKSLSRDDCSSPYRSYDENLKPLVVEKMTRQSASLALQHEASSKPRARRLELCPFCGSILGVLALGSLESPQTHTTKAAKAKEKGSTKA